MTNRRLLAAGALTAVALTAVALTVSPASADLGRAGFYLPPYTPTACNGSDESQFPSNGLFVAVGDAVWDNGAACGRRYQVRCLSGPDQPCIDPSRVIQVVVVDHCPDGCQTQGGPTVMKLSADAYDSLVKTRSTDWINIEFAQS